MIARLPASSWNFDKAAHLLVRAGFGGSPEQIQFLADQGPESAVNHLLTASPEYVEPPVWAVPDNLLAFQAQAKAAIDPEQKRELFQQRRQQANEEFIDLLRWWVDRMVFSKAPLVEKMTFFWHGHFATSAAKVHNPYRMWLQNATFRAHSLGNFNVLIKAVSRDPAMLVWLDLLQSQKAKPNENFARELMELFTLGEGNYTENDVKAAARAFTGYRIDPITQSFRFAPNQFDPTPKDFFDQTGPWNGDDIIDLIFSRPACSRFLVAKLWRFFISDVPDPAAVDTLARDFRSARFEMRPLLRAIFTSEQLYSDAPSSGVIKSPVQFIVQGSRSLGLPLPDPHLLREMFRRLGQEPFYPPNVKGWDGGKSWINTATLTTRYEISRRLVEGINPPQTAKPSQPISASSPAPGLAGTPGSSIQAMQMAGSPTMGNPGTQEPAKPLTANRSPFRPLPPLPIDHLVLTEDRNQPELLTTKLLTRVFQEKPAPDLVARFSASLATKPLPLADNAIRELICLMLATPNYQVC